MEIFVSIIMLSIAFSILDAQNDQELVECNAVYIDLDELEQMNLTQQEDYVSQNRYEKFLIKIFDLLGSINIK